MKWKEKVFLKRKKSIVLVTLIKSKRKQDLINKENVHLIHTHKQSVDGGMQTTSTLNIYSSMFMERMMEEAYNANTHSTSTFQNVD